MSGRDALVALIHQHGRTHAFEAQWAADAVLGSDWLAQEQAAAAAQALRAFADEIEAQIGPGGPHRDLAVVARQVRLVVVGLARERADRLAPQESLDAT